MNSVAPLCKDPAFSQPAIRQLGFVGVITMLWISNMTRALKLQQAGLFDALLRYEDLVSSRGTAVEGERACNERACE